MRLAVVAAAACLSVIGLSTAADAQASIRKLTNIPAQSLGTALQTLASDRGFQIVYLSEGIDSRRTQGATGDFTPEEALGLLLSGTGLTFRYVDAKTVTIYPLAASGLVPSAGAESAAQDRPAGASRTQESDSTTPAKAEERAPSQTSTTPKEENSSADRSDFTAVQGRAIPEVLVIGSRILNTDIQRTEDDAQPYMVFKRTDIERSGARNVEDFLARRLTASTSSTTNSQNLSLAALGNTSSIDLRGLGTDETLILVDGRRIAGFTISGQPFQPDINGIPLAAIERIEVLPATASGIYGGGATGGVINIILRRDYNGTDVRLTYGSSFNGGGDTRRADLSTGFGLGERTSVVLAGSYSDATEVAAEERDFVARGNARVMANNPTVLSGAVPPLGATTNVSSIAPFGSSVRPSLTLDNGTSLNSPITFVPEGYAGPASDGGAGLLANAGRYNLNLADTASSGRQALTNAPTLWNASATLRSEFTPWLDAYLELAASENSGEFLRGVLTIFNNIAGDEPGNPFLETIRVTTPLYGTDAIVESDLETERAAAGLIASLPFDWRAQVDYTWNRSRFSFVQPPFTINQTLAANDVENGTLNVFRDNDSSTIDFGPYLGGAISTGAQTTLDNVALRFGGPLPVRLPGGAASLSMVLEYRKQDANDQRLTLDLAPPLPPLQVLVPERGQTQNSAYLELRLPIASEETAIPGVSLLELQVAGRWDDYETVAEGAISPLIGGVPIVPLARSANEFSSTNPTFGLRYKPVSDLMLRGSYGTGFLPPHGDQIVVNPLTTILPAGLVVNFGLTDPRRGGERLGASGLDILVGSGGNPDLKPEESESWSAGLVLTPRLLSRLRVSADWTRIEKTGDIIAVQPLVQFNINQELLIPGLITRSTDTATFGAFAVGPIIGLDGRLRNVAHTEVEAYDFRVDYTWESERIGEIMLSTAATHFVRNEIRLVPLAPTVDTAGTIQGIPWRGHATLSWTRGNYTAAWTTRHFDSYRLFPAGLENPFQVTSQGSAFVPRQTYHDLFASYRFGSQAPLLLSDTTIQLGVNNVFNTRPPVDVTHIGAQYSSLGDPRLASYYLSVRKSF